MTRKEILFAFSVLMCSQAILADIKSDILALTGQREVRVAWLRIPWCDSSYAPIQAYSDDASLHTQVCVMSTAEPGDLRLLDSGKVAPHYWDMLQITRKDGSHVVWDDPIAQKAYIQAFDGTTPKVDLQLGSDWEVIAVSYTPATGEEALLVRSADKNSAYRIPLTSAYRADLTKKTQIVASSWSGGAVDDAFSVSADGKMAGGAFPWPTTKILDLVNKTAYVRHAGTFGCNSNIAPDNSYRFFHFFDSHDGLHMFGPALSTTYWDVPLMSNLPGNTYTGSLDGKLPRFTNDAQFMSFVYPGPETGLGERGNFDLTAADVKALNPSLVGHVIIGKFSADFKSIEKWAMVAGGDVRTINGTAGAMAWIAGSVSSIARPMSTRSSGPSLSRDGSAIKADFDKSDNVTLSLVDPTGRTVARTHGQGAATCVTGSIRSGIYFAVISARAGAHTDRVSIIHGE